MKNFNDYLKIVRESSEYPYNIMSLVIPAKSEWKPIKNEHSTIYGINMMNKIYTIPVGKEKWFTDNIGKPIKFKYISTEENPVMLQVELMKQK